MDVLVVIKVTVLLILLLVTGFSFLTSIDVFSFKFSLFHRILKEKNYKKARRHLQQFANQPREWHYSIIKSALEDLVKKTPESILYQDNLRTFFQQYPKELLLYAVEDLSEMEIDAMIKDCGYRIYDLSYSLDLKQYPGIIKAIHKYNFDMNHQSYVNYRDFLARLLNTDDFAYKVQKSEFWYSIEKNKIL